MAALGLEGGLQEGYCGGHILFLYETGVFLVLSIKIIGA